MELGLFDEVGELVRALAPEGLGEVRVRAHRRGVKVWFGDPKPSREHYEAQLIPRRFVDSTEGVAMEVGFHAEHRDPADNAAALTRVLASESTWRKALGPEAEAGPFLGADQWTRVSETWIEPDIDDPELAFELASRLVDYLISIEPARAPS